ncbi:MAG: beta-propeller fold lactonase family protein, partial [Planctomycetota bacterium]|nr:beta-propeller fold lactonase family protein [Planctomycetota bacterium]
LHASSGAISGTPSAAQAATEYTVRASNSGGSTTALISIEIQTARFAFASSAFDDTLLGYVVHDDQFIFNGFTNAPAGESGPGEPFASPDGAFLYVPNNDTANISVYAIDAASGALTPGSPVAVGIGPQVLTMNSTGTVAMVASAGSNELRSFTVDPASGALTQIGTALATDDDPAALALSPDDSLLIVAGATNPGYLQAYAVEEDGSLTEIGTPYSTSNGAPRALAISPDNQTLIASFDAYNLVASFEIDATSNPVLTLINTAASGGDVLTMDALPSGSAVLALVSEGATQQLRAIPLAADGTLGPPVAFDIDGGPLALTLSGSRAYVTSEDDAEVDLYSLDQTTGEPTHLRSFRTRAMPTGCAIARATSALAPRASHLYSVNSTGYSVSTFSVDSTDGTLTAGLETSTSDDPGNLVLDPMGEYAWVACPGGNAIDICTVDELTGELAVVETLSLGNDEPHAMCVDAAGDNLYLATRTGDGEGQLDTFPIDRASGALSLRIGLPLDALPRQITIDPTGRFLFVALDGAASPAPALGAPGSDSSAIQTFAIDPQNGFPAPVDCSEASEPAGCSTPTNNGTSDVTLRWAPSGARLFVAYADDTVRLLFSGSIDPLSGKLTLGSTFNTGPGTAMALEPHPSGRFAYAVVRETGNDHISSYDLEEETGELTN